MTEALGPTSTSLVDKMAREELQHENIEASSDKIRATYRKLYIKHNSFKLRLIGVALLTIMLIVFEQLTSVFNMYIPPILNVGIDWVLILFIAVISYDRIRDGIKQLFSFKSDVDSVLVVTLLFSVVFTLVTTLTNNVGTAKLFNAPFGICAVFSLVAAIFSSKRDIYSFRVASSKKEKKVIVPSEDNKITNGSKDYYEIDNVEYINEFFANKEIKASNKKIIKILLPVYFILAVIVLLVLLIKGENAYTYVLASYLTFSMLAPTSIFIAYTYPSFRLSKKAYNMASAVLGEASIEEYDNAKTIIFDDMEAFPPEKTKLKTITIFKSETDISEIIYYVSSVFSKVGGPLENVFKSATLDSKVSEDVKINKIEDKGIDAFVDGKRVVVGQPDYMRQQCFETVKDDEDLSYVLTSNKRVLYVACEDKVLAKFYIQYVTTKEFIRSVNYLNKAKLNILIRTSDPCIDDGLLEMNRLNKNKYNIGVTKNNEKIEKTDVVSAKKAGVITTGSNKNLIKTLLMCRNMPKLNILNLITTILTSLIGLVLIGFMILGGNLSKMISIHPVIYESICGLIIYVLSLVFI